MKKLDMQTPDITEGNVSKIGSLFPNVITEKEGANGVVEKAIDFELLKQMLSKEIVEDDTERYRLDWPGKKASLLKANTPTTKTLRPDRASSVNFDTTENVFIEGDNFEVLKVLQESYLGKIKMIYIDPPYNTGGDFVYKDNFTQDKDEYDEEIGAVDDEENKLFRNTESNGRFHSDWMSMMYERLLIARDLLNEEGVVFISIDDNEVTNLKKICDEIFGSENFIASIVRNTNSSKNQSLFVSVSHEYCLVYSRNLDLLKIKHAENKWSVKKNNVDEYVKKVNELKKMGSTDDEITEELKMLTKYPRFIDFTNYWYFDARGLYRKDNLGGVQNGNMTPLLNPLTGNKDGVPPGGYRYNDETLKKLIDENRIHFHLDGSLPVVKRYLNENLEQRPKSIMSDDQRPDYSLLQEMETPFDNPKQMEFMKRVIGIFEKDSLILDFFAGSGTTAHAIMELNAEDGGNRKFILVQIAEEISKDSEAYKAKYKYISEISKERIRRAGKKILEENKEELAKREKPLDIGFRAYKADSTNMKDVYYHPSQVVQEDLFNLVSNIKEDRSPEDLLTQVILDLGLTLDLPIEKKELRGNAVYFVAGNALVACFDHKIDFAIVDDIAAYEPLKVVFKDASFKEEQDRTNVDTRMKRLSPETIITVL